MNFAVKNGSPVPSETEIRLELEHLLSSSVFRGSKRCHDFTSYICGKVFEGAADTLKERTIAQEVFGRSPHEGFGDDNIVRVGAREVRRRLALYYSGEGTDNLVRIELPTGCYVPEFRYQSERPQPLSEPRRLNAPPAAVVRGWPRRYVWTAVAVVLVFVFGALYLRSARHSSAPFEKFWSPAFDSPTAVIVMPHPIAYLPSAHALLLDQEMNGKPGSVEVRAINVPSDRLDGNDFVPVFNHYVGFGDAIAAAETLSVLALHGRSAQLRLADKLEFSDLYGSTVILIGGAFANRWTAEITKNLRYQFLFEDQSKPWIVDSQSDKKWGLSNITDDRRTSEDYILICRMPHAQTGKFLVLVAGLTVFGTEAGGRILSNPKLLEPILQGLPKDWETRNLEIVMKVEVVGGGPVLPSLVAAYTW